MNTVTVEESKGRVYVKGDVSFDNAVTVLEEGLKLVRTLPKLEVDLKDMTQTDSSGLAVLIGWVRAAKQEKKSIRFFHLPDFMRDLSRVCGLENVLPIG